LITRLNPDHPDQAEIWRNAAQAWNHNFLWQSMRPGGGGRPPRGVLRDLLGSASQVREMFKGTAAQVFGSGWLWIMADPDGTPIFWSTEGADNPMRHGYLPLLACDCWEHAYYLDYPANREAYIDAFLDHLVNWEFASANWERAFG
jgi:Fe-Mn family superoxide dismutase